MGEATGSRRRAGGDKEGRRGGGAPGTQAVQRPLDCHSALTWRAAAEARGREGPGLLQRSDNTSEVGTNAGCLSEVRFTTQSQSKKAESGVGRPTGAGGRPACGGSARSGDMHAMPPLTPRAAASVSSHCSRNQNERESERAAVQRRRQGCWREGRPALGPWCGRCSAGVMRPDAPARPALLLRSLQKQTGNGRSGVCDGTVREDSGGAHSGMPGGQRE